MAPTYCGCSNDTVGRSLQHMKVSYSDFKLCDNARFYPHSVTVQTRAVYSTVNSKTLASTAVFWSLVTAYEFQTRNKPVYWKRIFGPRRDEVTGKLRRLHNEELNDCTPHPILCG